MLPRENLSDLAGFLAVAEEKSFTRAAAKLGTSQSALSHTVQRLEARLGIRLLVRTTRNVTTTEAGARLVTTLIPAFESIDAQLTTLTSMLAKPAGQIRISAAHHSANTILWPVLERLMPEYPGIHVELDLDAGLTDIVAGRFDAGVRLGERLAKDMVAVPIGPPLRMAVVGSPDYLERYGVPSTPHDLGAHRCLNLRMHAKSAIWAWEFERGGREYKFRVDGQLTVNSVPLIVRAALSGFGLACVLEDHVTDHIDARRLIRLLDDWCPAFPGYHLYYPDRQVSAAFSILVDALRYRPPPRRRDL